MDAETYAGVTAKIQELKKQAEVARGEESPKVVKRILKKLEFYVIPKADFPG